MVEFDSGHMHNSLAHITHQLVRCKCADTGQKTEHRGCGPRVLVSVGEVYHHSGETSASLITTKCILPPKHTVVKSFVWTSC